MQHWPCDHRRAHVFYTGWGSTETAPTSTATYWDTERVGLIGLPFPGVELKMVPVGAKYEIAAARRQRHARLFRPARSTKAAFDDEGFYCIATPACSSIRKTPCRASSSQAAWWRISSSPPAPSFIRLIAHRCHRRGDAGGAGRAGGRTGRPFVGLLAWPNLTPAGR